MRTFLQFGRQCLRQKPNRLISPFIRHEKQYSRFSRWRGYCRPPRPLRKCTIVLSLLSPAAFVALSEEEDKEDGKTPEEHMLEASRAEIAKELPDDVHGVTRAWRGFYLLVDAYITEPIATTLRFLHLVVIFVPVIVTIPLLLIGSRQKNRDNERSGTLWWYSFLVRSMERGGPAFIKVHDLAEQKGNSLKLDCNLAGPMGCFKIRHLSSRNVQHNVLPSFSRSGPLFQAYPTNDRSSI